ncbi:unnamed protein product [Mytilus edulis]|uniref:Uncharacterized protein n=1 Tax=Mytilus edulis TaxID=6550 RepID=A0A8S3QT53_MYTED|nr:unnamed protein product [Mytilus edulis]
MFISKQPVTSGNNIVLHESKSNDCNNCEEDNKSYTESKNYVDYSTLTNDIKYGEMMRPIETKVTDNDTAIFRVVVRKRTKRIVLYNVIADKPYELVNSAVRTYAEQKDVHITFIKLLKKRENRGGDCNIDLTRNATSSKLTCFTNFLNDRNLCPAPLLHGRVGPKYTFRKIKSNCPYEVSDHFPVFVQLNIDLISRTSNAYNINKKTLKWSKADDFELKMYQTEIDKLLNFETNSDNLSKGDVERFSSLLINYLHMASNSCIPVGTFRPYLKPYWKNQNLNNSHFEQRNARRKWINNNKTREKTDLSYVEYKNKKREFCKRKRIAEKLWQEEKFEDIKLPAEMDIGEFYQRVHRMRKSGPSTTKLSYNGTEATNDSSICELWGEYFRDLYSEQVTGCFDETFFHEISSKVQTYFKKSDKASVPELEKQITLEEIR